MLGLLSVKTYTPEEGNGIVQTQTEEREGILLNVIEYRFVLFEISRLVRRLSQQPRLSNNVQLETSRLTSLFCPHPNPLNDIQSETSRLVKLFM